MITSNTNCDYVTYLHDLTNEVAGVNPIGGKQNESECEKAE